MYQALYRKHRPRRFEDVVGQEHVTQTLCRQIIGDRLSHAYLFVGTRGTGKTTCAKILSRAVNCENPIDGEPCNKCASCIGIENGSILDVLEIDAASNNGVDNVRELREDAVYSPASVKKRVYIIDEVHMLSTAAFNALLKILEEPPEHLMFILATTELHKVPATILSRCQRFSFKRITTRVIEERLTALALSEGVRLTEDAASKLAALADGSMRDAVSLFDQCAADDVVDMARVQQTVGIVGAQETLALAKALADGSIPMVLNIFNTIYSEGRDLSSLLSEITTIIRDVLLFKLSKDSALLSGMYEKPDLELLSSVFSPARLLKSLEVARETLYTLSRGGNAKLTLEICLIRLCDNRIDEALPASGSTRGNQNAAIADSGKPSATAAKAVKAPEEPPPLDAGNYGSAAEDSSLNASSTNDKSVSEIENDITTDDISITGYSAAESPAARDSISEDNAAEKLAAEDSSVSEDSASEAGAANVGAKANSSSIDSNDLTDNLEIAPDAGSDAENMPTESFWSKVLELLRNDAAVYSLFSNSNKVTAEENDGIITIRTDDAFTINQINSKTNAEPLKEAASKVLGRPVTLSVQSSTGNDFSGNKLDRLKELRKLDIVNFK